MISKRSKTTVTGEKYGNHTLINKNYSLINQSSVIHQTYYQIHSDYSLIISLKPARFEFNSIKICLWNKSRILGGYKHKFYFPLLHPPPISHQIDEEWIDHLLHFKWNQVKKWKLSTDLLNIMIRRFQHTNYRDSCTKIRCWMLAFVCIHLWDSSCRWFRPLIVTTADDWKNAKDEWKCSALLLCLTHGTQSNLSLKDPKVYNHQCNLWNGNMMQSQDAHTRPAHYNIQLTTVV